MHMIQRWEVAQPRVNPFPAPVCEPCFEPMKLNGEYTPTVKGKTVVRREYQCRMCGAVMRVLRTAEAA
jgi:hypothetical protein